MLTCRVEFAGWSAFDDTYAPYRIWRLLDPPSDIVESGAELIEAAPDDHAAQEEWGARFRISAAGRAIRAVDDSEAFELFGGYLPEWGPNGEALSAIWRSLEDLRMTGYGHFGGVLLAVTFMARYMRDAEAAEGPTPEPVVEISPEQRQYLRSVVPRPVCTVSLRPRRKRGQNWAHWAALLAHKDVAGTPIRRGDIVLQLKSGDPEPIGLRGHQERVPRACLSTVADALTPDTLEPLELAQGPAWKHSVTALAKLLRLTQRAGWKDETSPLLIVRPLRSPASVSIVANSDDAAIFKLLAQVGGRMPHG